MVSKQVKGLKSTVRNGLGTFEMGSTVQTTKVVDISVIASSMVLLPLRNVTDLRAATTESAPDRDPCAQTFLQISDL